jgi:hypothetical protein
LAMALEKSQAIFSGISSCSGCSCAQSPIAQIDGTNVTRGRRELAAQSSITLSTEAISGSKLLRGKPQLGFQALKTTSSASDTKIWWWCASRPNPGFVMSVMRNCMRVRLRSRADTIYGPRNPVDLTSAIVARLVDLLRTLGALVAQDFATKSVGWMSNGLLPLF